MTFRERYRALFSPQRRWLDADADVLQVGGRLGPRERVALRADCLHRRLAFPGLSAAQRESALALAAERAAPAPGARYAVRWQGDVAQVWLLSADASLGLADDEVLVAETSLLPPPVEPECVRLIQLRRGVEGQVWREGDLKVSRWWAEAPPADAWARFLRAAGVASASTEPPALERLSPIAEPWGAAGRRLAWAPAQLESAAWTALVAIGALVTGWHLAALLTWSVAGALQAQRLEALRESAAPLIATRERAEVARRRIEGYTALAQTPVDYVLQAELRALLPADARLTSWSRDAAQLRVELSGGGDDPRTFVQALAAHPLFSSVIANPGGNGRMQLDIQLDGVEGEEGGAP